MIYTYIYTFPTIGQITVETKQLYLGKHKKVRNLRHVVFDSDLTLYMFKSVKDEGGSPISEISLKEGMTIYQEGEERKVVVELLF